MNIGTCISLPEEIKAGFNVFDTVSPLRPGSVLTISLFTKFGGSILRTSPFLMTI